MSRRYREPRLKVEAFEDVTVGPSGVASGMLRCRFSWGQLQRFPVEISDTERRRLLADLAGDVAPKPAAVDPAVQAKNDVIGELLDAAADAMGNRLKGRSWVLGRCQELETTKHLAIRDVAHLHRLQLPTLRALTTEARQLAARKGAA